MRRIFVIITALMVSCSDVVRPSDNQVEWADCEIGVMYTIDVQVFRPDYNWRNWGTHPAASVFNPSSLSTDQWLDAANKLGAGYAVLVAKHCSGFSLWPTEAHPYSVRSCPWKEGKGDIVGDFVESCKSHGVRPGLYASTSANGYFYVDNPGKVQQGAPVSQQEYISVVEKQMTELWSNYGPLFEIWFDGGVLPVEEGGPDLWPIIEKYQPNSIKFQGLKEYNDNIRWVGNEEGFAPDPCWATTLEGSKDYGGSAQGEYWNPGEADFTLRWNSSFQGGWFWHADEDDKLFTVEQLMEKYEKSVGRGCNMLLGIVVDSNGLVPDADMRRVEEFGNAIKAKYGQAVSSTSGRGCSFKLQLDGKTSVDRVVLQEDITKGERVLNYSIKIDGKEVYSGNHIGHKRIVAIDRCTPSTVELEILSSKARPAIRTFAVYR